MTKRVFAARSWCPSMGWGRGEERYTDTERWRRLSYKAEHLKEKPVLLKSRGRRDHVQPEGSLALALKRWVLSQMPPREVFQAVERMEGCPVAEVGKPAHLGSGERSGGWTRACRVWAARDLVGRGSGARWGSHRQWSAGLCFTVRPWGAW